MTTHVHAAQQQTSQEKMRLYRRALTDSFSKMTPALQAQNPVMFLVYVSAIITTVLFILALFGIKDAPAPFTGAIALILWFTVLFANFAEALAEGRGKAQADSLRAAKQDVTAHRLENPHEHEQIVEISSALLKRGDVYIVHAGEQIPADGEVIEGAASVDESAITGESAPVIREAGGDRSAVTGGTTILSDWLVVRVTQEAGESFLDKMIAMVEGAARKKTPNEIALQIFLIALSIIFLLVCTALYTYSVFAVRLAGAGSALSITALVALLVCLAPTTVLEPCHSDWYSNMKHGGYAIASVLEPCHSDWYSNTANPRTSGTSVLEPCHSDWYSNAHVKDVQLRLVLEPCHSDWYSNKWRYRCSQYQVLEPCHSDWYLILTESRGLIIPWF